MFLLRSSQTNAADPIRSGGVTLDGCGCDQSLGVEPVGLHRHQDKLSWGHALRKDPLSFERFEKQSTFGCCVETISGLVL